MNLRTVFAAMLLIVSAPTMAGTIKIYNLGNLSVPGSALIGSSFSTVGQYQDDYVFSIGESASAGGLVLELDSFWNRLNIDVTSISLTGAGGFAGPSGFGIYNFGNLAAGQYTLSIFSTVTSNWGITKDPVGYAGLIGLKDSSTQVPEPATLGLLGLGLLGVGVARRRR